MTGVGTIAAITNPELGAIREVGIPGDGLEYAILLADGTILNVEAEQEPGRIYQPGSGWSSRVVSDWRCVVDFESLSALHRW
jgi:hypothetical protein